MSLLRTRPVFWLCRWGKPWAVTMVLAALGCAPPPPASEEEPQKEGRVGEQTTAAPLEEELVNTLRWTTASEVENFGYDVYRASREEGPFERITVDPILGAGTTDEPSAYSYIDDTIDPTREYFYYVESVSMSGERDRFTPVIRAEAKIGGAEDASKAEDAR